ncbi:MAG: GNAT family N-acetyltransferase, partial [Anaerolineae bacterium]|nr:GNAT family N-acetyltransferase [Anaerolineae bacterium]
EDYMAMDLDVAIDNVWTPAGLAYLQEQLQDKARIRVVWLTAAPDENHRRDALRPPSDVQGARVDELQAELDALEWPEAVLRLDTTGQTVEQTLDAIERAFDRDPATLPRGLSLRPSTPADADFICAVMRATMTDYVMQAWAPSEAAAEAAYREDIIIGQDHIVVLSGREIGVFSIERKPDEIFLDKLFILPDYQRWGIGSHLIRMVLAEAFGQSLPVRLGVLKVNPARSLYERLGFVVEGEEGASYLMGALPPGL